MGPGEADVPGLLNWALEDKALDLVFIPKVTLYSTMFNESRMSLGSSASRQEDYNSEELLLSPLCCYEPKA